MVDSTEQNRSKKLIMKQREQIDEAVKKLDEADKAMMSWMRNIPAVDEMPESEALETIEEEHQKIKQVDSDINEAIADASEILKKQ